MHAVTFKKVVDLMFIWYKNKNRYLIAIVIKYYFCEKKNKIGINRILSQIFFVATRSKLSLSI